MIHASEISLLITSFDPRTLLRLVVAVISILVGVITLLRNMHKPSIMFFGLTAFFAGLWSFLGTIGQAVLPDVTTAYFWIYSASLIAPFIGLFMTLMAIHIGQEHQKTSMVIKVAVTIPATLLFALGVTFPGIYYKSVSIDPISHSIIPLYTPYYRYLFAPIISLLLFLPFPILIHKYIRAYGRLKLRLRYILIGCGISVGMGILGNLILPLLGIGNLIWVGSATIIIFTITVLYAFTREQLWDLKLLLTEISLLIIILTLLIDIFFTTDPVYITFKLIALAFLILFGIFLIRAVTKEVNTKRKLHFLASKLALSNQRLREIDKERSRFVSIVSHQLRTPLTVIKGYSSMALEGSFGPFPSQQQREIMQKIREASERLVLMIDEFLNISRVEKGELVYTFSIVDINNLLHDIVNELKIALPTERNRVILQESHTRIPLYTIADSVKIRQVITTLIDNALKFSPHDKTISIKSEKRGGDAVICVKDDGFGMTKNELQSLFKKDFFEKKKKQFQDLKHGLALFMAYKIILAHGGKLTASSKGHGKGTTFCIFLPVIDPSVKRKELKDVVTKMS